MSHTHAVYCLSSDTHMCECAYTGLLTYSYHFHSWLSSHIKGPKSMACERRATSSLQVLPLPAWFRLTQCLPAPSASWLRRAGYPPSLPTWEHLFISVVNQIYLQYLIPFVGFVQSQSQWAESVFTSINIVNLFSKTATLHFSLIIGLQFKSHFIVVPLFFFTFDMSDFDPCFLRLVNSQSVLLPGIDFVELFVFGGYLLHVSLNSWLVFISRVITL